jgi:hypothetical protein
VNVDHEREEMTRFVASQNIDWPQYWDKGDRVTRDVFAVDAFPTEIILDHEGVEVGRSKGWGTSSSDVLARRVLDALGPARKALKAAGAERRPTSQQ